MRLAPLAEVAAHHRGADPLVPRGEEQRRRAAVREPDHPDAVGVDQRMLLEHVEARGRDPRGSARAGWRRRRPRARGRGRSRTCRAGSSRRVRRSSAGRARARRSRARRAGARSRRCARRSRRGSSRRRDRRPPPCRGRDRAARAPPGRAACGRAARAGTPGTDIVASVSNTIDSRRYEPQSTISRTSRSSGTALGHRPEQRVEARPAPVAPRGDRARIVDRARIARDEQRRGAASSRPTVRSCAPVRSRGGDGTVRT